MVKVNDYQYFIQSAVQKDLPWNTLAMFLTDLAPTLDKSRQIIKILVQEREKWVAKVENEADYYATISILGNITQKLLLNATSNYSFNTTGNYNSIFTLHVTNILLTLYPCIVVYYTYPWYYSNSS